MRTLARFILATLAALLVVTNPSTLLASGAKDEAAPPPPGSATKPPPPPPMGSEAKTLETSPDDVMVEVNGEKLTRAEVMEGAMNLVRAQGGASLPPQAMAQMMPAISQQVMDAFVAQTLLLAEADAKEIVLEEGAVDEMVTELSSQLPAGVDLATALQQFGTTEAEMREDVARDLRIRKLVEGLTADEAAIADEDVTAFYEKSPEQFTVPELVTASHILITVEADADDETKAEKKKIAEEIRQELLDGADFAELARAKSEGPSAPRGGELGSFGRGQMVKAFEEAAFSQKAGEIGAVVETPFGFHIIKVAEHGEAKTQSLDEVKEDIASYLAMLRDQELVQKHIEELKADAEIKYAE